MASNRPICAVPSVTNDERDRQGTGASFNLVVDDEKNQLGAALSGDKKAAT
jgi:hypothetical protein